MLFPETVSVSGVELTRATGLHDGYAFFTVGFLIAGAPRFLMLVTVDRLWAVYLVSFLSGLAIAAVNPILGAVVYERVPQRLRARVLGPAHAIFWAGIPLGSLLGGQAVERTSLSVTCLLFGGAYLLVTLIPVVAPVWRDLDRRSPADHVGEADDYGEETQVAGIRR